MRKSCSLNFYLLIIPSYVFIIVLVIQADVLKATLATDAVIGTTVRIVSTLIFSTLAIHMWWLSINNIFNGSVSDSIAITNLSERIYFLSLIDTVHGTVYVLSILHCLSSFFLLLSGMFVCCLLFALHFFNFILYFLFAFYFFNFIFYYSSTPSSPTTRYLVLIQCLLTFLGAVNHSSIVFVTLCSVYVLDTEPNSMCYNFVLSSCLFFCYILGICQYTR